jgi:hypothetical protein
MMVWEKEFPSPVAMAKYEMAAKVVIMAVMMWKSRFCYGRVSMGLCRFKEATYNWDAPCHDIERNAGQQHDGEDNLPCVSIGPSCRSRSTHP